MRKILAAIQMKSMKIMSGKSAHTKPERRRILALLGGLYTAQLLGLSFIITAFPAILRQSGAGLETIGWIYGLGMVWSVNVFWAPVVDRYGSRRYGHYRGWIIAMQTLLIAILIGTSRFDPTADISILMVLFGLVALFSATQDIAVDAMAVTLLKPEERGMGNGVQAAGNLIGGMIGGGVVLITYQWLGWNASLLTLALITAVPLIGILRHRERRVHAIRHGEKAGFAALIRFFKRPRIWRWIMVLMVFRASNMVNYGLLNPILVDLGWSLDRIGIALNIVGPFFGIAGSVAGGWIVSRRGRKSAMLFSMVLVTLATAGLFIPASGIDHAMVVHGIIGLIMAAYGCGFAVMYTIIMDKSDPVTAGTDFTLQMSISGFSAFTAVGLAMRLAASVGYAGVLSGCLGFAAISLCLIATYDGFDPDDSEADVETRPGCRSSRTEA